MNYRKIRRTPPQLLSLTGLGIPEFDSLRKDFEVDLKEQLSKLTFAGKERQRIYKPRKNSVLPTTRDKLFFILVYLKNNPLQEQLAAMFSMSQPKANAFIHILLPILRKTLKRLGEVPERRGSRMADVLIGQTDVLLDGTERPIQRPSDYEVAAAHYSGKKTHNLKNNMLTLPDLRIVWLSPTYEGKVHDKHICDSEQLELPEGITLWQDGGFLGHKPAGVAIKMPTRKPSLKCSALKIKRYLHLESRLNMQ